MLLFFVEGCGQPLETHTSGEWDFGVLGDIMARINAVASCWSKLDYIHMVFSGVCRIWGGKMTETWIKIHDTQQHLGTLVIGDAFGLSLLKIYGWNRSSVLANPRGGFGMAVNAKFEL